MSEQHGNNYNLGDIVYTDMSSSTIRVHDGVFSLYEDNLSDDLVSYRSNKILEEEMYEIFKNSIYFEKYSKPKKIDKNDLIKMFYHFKESLLKVKLNKYSNMDIFLAFAEFFEVNYDFLYSEISVLDKEYLLKELNEKYGLNDRIKSKKLF